MASERRAERKQGLSIDRVTVGGQDITGSVTGIMTYEGIHAGFIEADLMIVDQFNLIGTLDGDRLIPVDIAFRETAGRQDDVEPYEISLVLNTIDRFARYEKESIDSYMMHCVNPAVIVNEKIAVSRSYTGKTIDSVVNSMLDILGYEGPRDIASTGYQRDMIVPNMRPMETIAWLGKYAASDRGNAGEYLMYQTADALHFKPVTDIIQDPVRKYRFVSEDIQSHQSDYDLSLTQIQIKRAMDVHYDTENNADGLPVFAYDIETGTYSVKNVTDRDYQINTNEVRNIGITGGRDKWITVHSTGFYSPVKQQDQPAVAKPTVNSARSKRMSASIELPGENVIKAGSVIELEHRITNPKEDHAVIQGRWLIQRMKRIVTTTGYVIHADITSDRILDSGGFSGLDTDFDLGLDFGSFGSISSFGGGLF